MDKFIESQLTLTEEKEPTGGHIHPKQKLLNLVENTPLISWNFYESDHFYNVEILLAAEVSLKGLMYRMPEGVMFHINGHTRHFEFFIDKDS